MGKVLVLGKYYPPFHGGVEATTRDISETLAAEHDVVVYCFNHEKGIREDVINRVRVKRFAPFLTLQSQPLSLSLFFATIWAKADVIHLHAPNFLAVAGLYVRYLLPGKKAKLIITHHTDIVGREQLKRWVLPLYTAILRKSDCVIVGSRKLVDISTDLIEGPDYRVIAPGIHPEEFGELDALSASGRRDKPLGFLGRHVRYKGVNVLLRALQKLPGVSAKIAGNGPLRAGSEALAAELGLADRAAFLGHLPDLNAKLDFYRSLGIFVFPSTEITESFGITQLEAMIMGVPVIASDLPTGVTDVSIHEKTALLVPPGDPDALAAAISRLKGDDALCQRLIENARAHVLSHFTHEIAMQSTVALFNEVLARP